VTTEPAHIEPDTKSWTWVLDERCPECGVDTRDIAPADVADLVRRTVPRWRAALEGEAAGRRTRPQVWSPLEYACHVRDVYRIYDERLALMLATDDPHFADWDQDATAVEDRYGEQDPVVVADELAAAAASLAARFDTVSGARWERTGERSDGARFTVATFARYFAHDPLHHLYDVTGSAGQ
jgi:hypothetical protein